MNFTPELILQLGAMLLGAAATYGAIKSDLKALHDKSKENEHVRDHLTGVMKKI